MPKPVRVSFAIAGAKELEKALSSVERRIKAIADAEMKMARASASAMRRPMASARAAGPGVAGGTYRQAGIAGRSFRDVEREAQAHARRMERIKERSALMAGRYAAKAANDEIRQQQRVERAAQKASAARRAAVVRGVGNAARGTIGSIAGVAGGLGLTAGGFAISNALMGAARLKSQAQQMVNASTDSKGNLAKTKGGQQLDANYLTGYAQRMSTTYGVDPTEVLTGLSKVSERAGGGEALASVMESWEDLTKTAVTYGNTMEDLGGVVAAALDAGVKPGKELNKIVQDFVAMGKLGSIEYSDLSSELAKLKGAGISYDMQGGDMLRSMVALTQIGARAAVTPEESRTALKDIGRDVGMKRKFLEKSGVTTLSNGKNRNAFDLLADIIDTSETKGLYGAGRTGRAKGTPGIEGIFSGTSLNIVKELNEIYRGKDKDKFGTGREAVMKALKEFSGAELPAGERDKRFGEVMNTEVAQAQVAFQKFNVEISKMLPQVMKLMPEVLKVTQGFAKLAVAAAENPFLGLGAVFTAKLGSEIGGAAIGKTVEAGFENIFTSLATGKGSKGVAGFLGALGTVALTAGVVYLAAQAGLDELFKSGEEAGKEGLRAEVQSVGTQREAQKLIASGSATPEQKERLIKKLDEEAAMARRSSNVMSGGTIAGGTNVDAGMLMGQSMGGGVGALFAGLAEMLVSKTAEQQGTNAESLKELEKNSYSLASALVGLKTVVESVSGGSPNRSGSPPPRKGP